MEHLETAGAPAGTPGTDGLTINDLPDDMIIHIFSMMDIESLMEVAKVCTRWKQLYMTPYVWKYACLKINNRNCVGIINNILPLVANYLRNVDMYLKNFSDGSQFISHCPNLTRFEINVWEVDSNIFDYFHHWPNLTSLSFLVRGKIQPCCAARNSASNLPYVANKLKILEMVCYPNSLEAAQFRTTLISYCPNLTHFEIDSEANRSIFDDLHHLPNLKFLSFDGTLMHRKRGADRMMKDSAYSLPFEKLKYLETLIMSSFSLTRNSLFSMLKCENLASIDMQSMKNIPADFLESLFRIKQSTLLSLYIYGDTLNDDVMRHICNCRLLQVLCIRTCDTLSDSSLLHLPRLKNLQTLELFSGKFSSSAMVEYLTKNTFQQMKCMRVPGCFPLTPQVIDIINRNAPSLERFYHNDYFIDKACT